MARQDLLADRPADEVSCAPAVQAFFVEAVRPAGDVLVGSDGYVREFFPLRPLGVGPLSGPPAGQCPDREDVSQVVGVSGGEVIPLPTLANQPGLEVPEANQRGEGGMQAANPSG